MRTSTSAAQLEHSAEQSELESNPQGEGDEGSERKRSRRSFFFLGAMAAASLLPGTAKAQVRSRVRRPADRSQLTEPTEEFRTVRIDQRPAAFNEWGSDAAAVSRLVRRVTMGVTAADM